MLSTTPVTDELWLFTFGEFKHSVAHHVEEEESEIFEKARKYLSSQEAKDLAREMDVLKKQVQAETRVPADAMG